jgi:hypothetical protein
MKKLLLLMAVLLVKSLPAQLIYDDTRHQQYVFRYASSNPVALNNILKRLAEGNNRSLLSMELRIEYRQLLSIMRSGNSIKVTAFYDMINTIGPVYFRGMDVSSLLIPSSMDILLARYSEGTGRSAAVEHRFTQVPIVNKTARAEEQVDDPTHIPWTVALQQVSFHFSTAAQQAFYDHTSRINDYYRDAAAIQQDIKMTAFVDPRDFESFEMHHARLELLEKNLHQYESRPYVSILNLHENDPAGWLVHLSVLKEKVSRLRAELNQTYHLLPQLFYDKAMWYFGRGNVHQARMYLGRSLSFNPMFAPAALQLARIEFRSGNLCDADMHVRQILHRMTPDPVTYELAITLARDLYDEYLVIARQQLKQGKAGEAHENLLAAQDLCRDVSPVHCSNDLDELLEVARNGLYKNLLDAAAAHYRNNELDKAERKLREARQLRERFHSQIVLSETEKVIGTAIIQKRYDDRMMRARSLIASAKYREALEQIEFADELAVTFPEIKPSADRVALRQQAAIPLVMLQIDEGLTLAEANRLDDARKKAREAEQWILNYQLDNTDVNSRLTELKNRIFSQECKQAQERFNEYYRQGNQAATTLDFIKAFRLYSSAEETENKNRDCALQTLRLKEEMQYIHDGYTYQSMIESVLEMHQQEQYAASLERYLQAGDFFQANNVKRYGLQHLSLDEFTEMRCGNNFIKYMGEKALRDMDFEKSLRLFKLILSRGYDPRFIKSNLNRLGRALAARDKALNPRANPKKLVNQYTEGDKKLRELRKGYLRGWKAAR